MNNTIKLMRKFINSRKYRLGREENMKYNDSLDLSSIKDKDYADKLRYLRESHHITKSQFARDLGISRPYLDGLEKGEAIPSFELDARIIYYYDLPDDFFNIGNKDRDGNESIENRKRRKPSVKYILDTDDLFIVDTLYQFVQDVVLYHEISVSDEELKELKIDVRNAVDYTVGFLSEKDSDEAGPAIHYATDILCCETADEIHELLARDIANIESSRRELYQTDFIFRIIVNTVCNYDLTDRDEYDQMMDCLNDVIRLYEKYIINGN